jgi:adenylate cyclase class 2
MMWIGHTLSLRFEIAMKYEVENKFRVPDLEQIVIQLRQLGAEIGETVQQADLYFAHPSRDFADTDEALRIRRVGNTNRITYKGPKIDQATKTRQELEVALVDGPDHFQQYAQLLELLGFRRVTEVKKRRRNGTCQFAGSEVEIALDDVDDVGTYLELEIVATDETIESARATIVQLAEQLNLTAPERRSYLELLLENTRG